jgi:histidinol-phosphatase (PHP family)
VSRASTLTTAQAGRLQGRGVRDGVGDVSRAYPSATGAVDLHLHSTCSADGVSSIGEYARRASRLGLREVGFCEHADWDTRDRGCGFLDLERYDREIAAARAAVPGIGLRQGVEVTYQSIHEAQIRAWLDGHAWDYVVVAVHLVDYADGWAMVSEAEGMQSYCGTHSARQAYVPYFEELVRAVESGLGDVVAHLDLVKRFGTLAYGRFDPAAFEGEIRAVLRAMAETGVGLEVNTSGLRQAPGEPYPALAVLNWYREMGGEIVTVGSDSHEAGHLGAGIAQARALAWAAGYRAVATFEGRRVRWMDLGGDPSVR